MSHTRASDPLTGLFALRPTRGAVVSEISEATAASPVPPEERVNFHIGNPIQDSRLVDRYCRIALGLPAHADLSESGPETLVRELGWDPEEGATVEFLLEMIRKSAPYLPRGGFLINRPGELIQLFRDWLARQAEPLAYDFGEKTGHREVILASGGVIEVLRVFFHGLATQLHHLPADVFAHGIRIPPQLRQFGALHFHLLPDAEGDAVDELRRALETAPQRPSFLLLGRIISEQSRRALRHLSLERPLFLIEVNDAPNHLSLAREARLANRVLRFLSPAVFSPELRGLSTVFVAGYEEFIRLIETVHFQLKGTPSAAEVELLTYLVKRRRAAKPSAPAAEERLFPETGPAFPRVHQAASAAVDRMEVRLEAVISRHEERVSEHLSKAAFGASTRIERAWYRAARVSASADPLEGLEFRELIDAIPARADELIVAFRAAFIRHHPEYRPEASRVVSGSARTALGLLGFHCGIQEVVIPDLSWTYEHCFPKVTSVPLTEAFELDVKRMIEVVEEKVLRVPDWPRRGAVVFNNPHNASGQVFSEEALCVLLRHFLERGILVIDDLSYQNVAPAQELRGPRTLRQLVDDQVRLGYLSSEHGDRLVTVHSLSKTDCMAGARLCVVEIRDPALRRRFESVLEVIAPNLGAVLLGYLFYRSGAQQTNEYWRLRNAIFDERMSAIEKAAADLPPDRNPFGITIQRPPGSMYPRMTLQNLPSGISLDWIASGLARQGIGLIPLSTFAHTEQGFETGRKSFRLTLGGQDGADRLLKKTRRVLIDMNRLIADEESHYNRKSLRPVRSRRGAGAARSAGESRWAEFVQEVLAACPGQVREEVRRSRPGNRSGWPESTVGGEADPRSLDEFLEDRVRVFGARFRDRWEGAHSWVELAAADEGRSLEELLEQEWTRDASPRRRQLFRRRLYDRTVHPTQMYSIQSELLWDRAIDGMVRGRTGIPAPVDLARELGREFLGLNVAVDSRGEGSELLLDLDSLVAAADSARFGFGHETDFFLSYWGDWDGSNRPSGQGHRLVATVVMENVDRMGRLFRMLLEAEPGLSLEPGLIDEVRRLPATNRRSRALFDEITDLTHQLERRYRGLLPFDVRPGIFRRLGMMLHVARAPVFSLWEHNDQLERRMLELRAERRRTLESYFRLNKALRKALRANLPSVRRHLKDPKFALAAVACRDLLRRFVITPRIHQNLVTSPDPFAIDTTVHNIMEINEISGRYGNPGMVLALQVSMSSDAEALISLDRKMRAQRDEVLRGGAEDLPSIWLVPLFEGVDEVQSIPAFLGKLWEYSVQSRRLAEETRHRFSETLCEVFIAGSDLSQQVGQTAGLALYRQAKYEIVRWLAERDLVGRVRLKMGSGEPMQRQGGYYAPVSGRPAFLLTAENEKILGRHLEASAQRSARYATTPLMGIFASGDLRTLQSNVSERLRHLPAAEFAQVLHHLAAAQRFSSSELRRAAEPLTETRLQFSSRGLQELERLTVGMQDSLFGEFMKLSTENFRRVLYGEENDVVGIYLISYFIARAMPPLRDRPTVRPAPGSGAGRGQKILERIAATIPFARYGSSLRAIAHNQAQTFLLGVNQLTTGLFRALGSFARQRSAEGEGVGMLADRILPHLPVYEILQSLRLYQDMELHWLGLMERGFPAGNSAFMVLREDIDSIRGLVPLFQREVVRRHGVQVSAFFEGDRFISRLLPTLRPDLAVLLQRDLFNTRIENLLSSIGGPVPPEWQREVEALLLVPERIQRWRRKAWELLQEPVFTRVSSFVELATALHSVARRGPGGEAAMPSALPRKLRDVRSVLRGPAEDSLQQFLVAAVEYFSTMPRGSVELPTSIVRAMKEVERLVRIEEQALPPSEQDRLRFYLLQIARAGQDNG